MCVVHTLSYSYIPETKPGIITLVYTFVSVDIMVKKDWRQLV